MRSADYAVPLSVFLCECWLTTADGVATYVIPFCMRAEIGQSAYARAYLKQTNGNMALSYQELAAQKGFRFVPPSVSIKAVSVRCYDRLLGSGERAHSLGHPRKTSPASAARMRPSSTGRTTASCCSTSTRTPPVRL